METRGRSPRYLNLFLNLAGLGFGDGRKVTLWAKEDLFAVNFSSCFPSLLALMRRQTGICGQIFDH
jgi:hypothetical protein